MRLLHIQAANGRVHPLNVSPEGRKAVGLTSFLDAAPRLIIRVFSNPIVQEVSSADCCWSSLALLDVPFRNWASVLCYPCSNHGDKKEQGYLDR